jgi:two-component system chemotaxis response regulator CheB
MSKIGILIINDSRSMRIFLEKIVKSFSDCELMSSCWDGDDAINCIQIKKPDVILLDLEMPHMDGLTFLEILPENQRIPTIIISNYGKDNSDIISDAINLGAVDSLLPPSSLRDEEVEKFTVSLHHKIMKASLKSNEFTTIQ